jgi:hypothetical protein
VNQLPIEYRLVTDGADDAPNNLLAGMLRCRHAGNPDFAALYPQVRFWFVEVEGGRVRREIGFAPLVGSAGDAVPVVLAPFGRNPGLWTKLEVACGPGDGTPIGAREFEAAWRALLDRLGPAAAAV